MCPRGIDPWKCGIGTDVDESGTVCLLGAGSVVTTVLETAVSVAGSLPSDRDNRASDSSLSSDTSESLTLLMVGATGTEEHNWLVCLRTFRPGANCPEISGKVLEHPGKAQNWSLCPVFRMEPTFELTCPGNLTVLI